MENGTETAVLDSATDAKDLTILRAPHVVMEEARKAIDELAQVIRRKKRPIEFNGEQYLEYEDWALLGKFYGVTAKVSHTNFIEFGETKGFEAKAVAFHVPTGQEISAAEALCLNDEPNWIHKPLFQLKSMAQTRACAKALRNVLSWVVVQGGFRPTPAEEMTGLERPAAPQPKVSSTDRGTRIVAGFIGLVKDRGQAASGKKYPYTVETTEGYIFRTWDDDLARQAKEEKASGHRVTVEYRETRFGLEIVSIERVADENADYPEPRA